MNFVSKFVTDVDNLILNNTLLDNTAVENINVKNLEDRDSLIKQLEHILEIIPDIASKAEIALIKAREKQQHDILELGTVINKIKKTDPDEWKLVTRKKDQQKARIGATTITQVTGKYSKIKITDTLFLPAISVCNFDDVIQDGELYYVESADHFAFKISGQLMHGNIGTIYNDEKCPEKIKDCRFAGACIKRDKCDYYHNPLKFPGSKDRRNFIASTWMYNPSVNNRNRYRSRKFGSLSNLDVDILGMHDDEISRFQDQVIHDLLCSLLLSQTYK